MKPAGCNHTVSGRSFHMPAAVAADKFHIPAGTGHNHSSAVHTADSGYKPAGHNSAVAVHMPAVAVHMPAVAGYMSAVADYMSAVADYMSAVAGYMSAHSFHFQMNYRLLLTKKQVMSINMLHYNHFFRICKVYDKIYEKKFIKIL